MQTPLNEAQNTLMCFIEKQTIMAGLRFVYIALELKLLLHYTSINEGVFPHGFGGLSLLKVFYPSSNFQVCSSCHAFLHMCTTHTYSSQKSLLLSSTTQESTFSTLMLLTLFFCHPNLGTPCLLSGGSCLPLVLLQTMADL